MDPRGTHRGGENRSGSLDILRRQCQQDWVMAWMWNEREKVFELQTLMPQSQKPSTVSQSRTTATDTPVCAVLCREGNAFIYIILGEHMQ